ncbi:sigma-70 family RNA polymerase sigma factor [Streptomyces sp. NPDC014983]|uniref:sigma-70 family RNA polymerase sigma factor n=1 Tax=Streptomyces sp. NPDC014983 TaxID=3364933 RepID=UPI0036FB26B0
MTTAPAKPAILTPNQHRVATQLIYGMPISAIARQVFLSVRGVESLLSKARKKMGCPGSSPAVLVHALLTAREIPPLATTEAAPDLTEHERTVIRAIAEHTRNEDIGNAIGAPAGRVRAEIDAVVAKAGARSAHHLVSLAWAWDILGDTAAGPHAASTSSTAGPL